MSSRFGRHAFDAKEIVARAEESMNESRRMLDVARQDHDGNLKARFYARYGVNNDFDLIERMYEEDCHSVGNFWDGQWFDDLRIECAMNPEYTKRCLESDAFWDVRDEILRRFGDA